MLLKSTENLNQLNHTIRPKHCTHNVHLLTEKQTKSEMTSKFLPEMAYRLDPWCSWSGRVVLLLKLAGRVIEMCL